MLTSVILQERLKGARDETQRTLQEKVAARMALNAAEMEPGKFRRLNGAHTRYDRAREAYDLALAAELGTERALKDRLEQEADG